MRAFGLTNVHPAATTICMQWIERGAWRSCRRACGVAALMLVAASMLSGCISVTAPDKPIVIELNINIKQEVIYRLSQDAGNTIETNPGIF
jgi:hypothetical protein